MPRKKTGILSMSPLDWVETVMDFSQTSLDNTLHTIKEVHQTIAEIPIDVAQEFGLPQETANALKSTHRRVLNRIHAGFSDACAEVHQYMIRQARAINKLTDFDADDEPEERPLVRVDEPQEIQQPIKLN
jgi:hypothetical protein